MATFRLGQRVRVVNTSVTAAMGREATVMSVGETQHHILIDGFPSPYHNGQWRAYPFQIEPIQPEGNQVVAWSECAWQPEHMREVA